MSSISSTQFESLSNEILLDIFVYLDAYHMCQAFYGLNARMNSLIQCVPLHLRCDGSMIDETIWNAVATIYKSSQIRILSCFGDMKVDKRILRNSMEKLRTIVLYNMVLESIDDICKHISSDNQIKCLSVQSRSERWYKESNQSISNCILVDHSNRFLSLTHLSFVCHSCQNFPMISVVFPHLRYLSLKNFYFSNDLLQLLQTNMPSLQSLKFHGLCHVFILSTIIIKCIHELDINVHNDILSLVGVLSNFPSLRRLHIECNYHETHTVPNDFLWQQSIEQYCPDLEELTIDFNPNVNEEFLLIFYQGDYWSNKKIKVKRLINRTESDSSLVKTISFGKEWYFHYFDNLNFTKLLSC